MSIKLKNTNNYNNIINKIKSVKKNKNTCNVINEFILTSGFSGDKVSKILCKNGNYIIKKTNTYNKLPNSKQFFNFFKLKNKFALLRELIINLYLKNLKIKTKIFPKLKNWNIETNKVNKHENKVTINLYYEYIEGISLLNLFHKNKYNGQTIINSESEYIKLFQNFFENLYFLNKEIQLQHNDLKADNLIIEIDKNNKPTIILLDFGYSSIPNLKLSSLKYSLLTQFWNIYYLSKKTKRAYDNRTTREIYKNSNKSHLIDGDLKFLIITFVQGYRKLFNKPEFTLLDSHDIKKINSLNYGEKLLYIVNKIKEINS